MSKLTKESRDALSDDDYAVPGKRKLPIPDAKHVRMAWDMVSKTKGLTSAERAEARRRILARAKKFGIDTSDWQKGQVSAVAMHARSLDLSNTDHPNKMPFSGIMTRIDEPSDSAPEGSSGRRVMLTHAAADKALDSLLGMAVDYVADWSGHDPTKKIGVITAAHIEGNAIHIDGFIYAADFPEVAAEIKANKSDLGFSFEARDLFTSNPDADPIPIVDCVFTGAAILLKDKAAYRTTSIVASATDEGLKMDKEIKDQFDAITAANTKLVEAVSALAGELAEVKKLPGHVAAANHLSKVEPFATRLESQASELEGAGIGSDPRYGHGAVLRAMAANLRAEAAMGRLPARFDAMYFAAGDAGTKTDASVEKIVKEATETLTKQIGDVKAAAEADAKKLKDDLAAAQTLIADLKANAARTVSAPERKTTAPGVIKLLAKAGIEQPEEGKKLTGEQVDKMLANMEPVERIRRKTELHNAGLID